VAQAQATAVMRELRPLSGSLGVNIGLSRPAEATPPHIFAHVSCAQVGVTRGAPLARHSFKRSLRTFRSDELLVQACRLGVSWSSIDVNLQNPRAHGQQHDHKHTAASVWM
jgi:hypothetical protein